MLDGFTRLFKLKLDVPVFIKVYSKDMSVSKTIKLLLQLNYWKTIGQGGYRNRATTMMLDRGFTLYTFMRSGINLAERRADCPIARHYDTTFTAIIRLYLDELRPNGERDLSSNLGAVAHDRFFDDIILLHKLHGIQLEGKIRYKSESCQLYLPMDFYHVLAKLRTTWIQRGQGNDVISMDIVAFEKWLKADAFMVKTFHEYYSKVNQNGKNTANENLTQYFVNKYFKPVVLGMEGVLTEIELKEQYRKDVLAFKRQFVAMKQEDYLTLPIGTKMFTFNVNYPTPIYVTTYIWKGIKEHKYSITSGIGNRTPKEYTDIKYVFSTDFFGTDDQEIMKNWYELNNSTYYKFFILKK